MEPSNNLHQTRKLCICGFVIRYGDRIAMALPRHERRSDAARPDRATTTPALLSATRAPSPAASSRPRSGRSRHRSRRGYLIPSEDLPDTRLRGLLKLVRNPASGHGERPGGSRKDTFEFEDGWIRCCATSARPAARKSAGR
jgi:hypothetical protein